MAHLDDTKQGGAVAVAIRGGCLTDYVGIATVDVVGDG
tara:strand:- start:1131 stop:1244 length:114 start_codon:yes stop_codon:yes gene_type:complete